MAQERLDFAELYRSQAGMVRARIRRFFPEHEVADVLQDVFLRAMEKRHRFRGDSSAATWLYQVTTRYCLNRLRDQGRRHALGLERGPMMGPGDRVEPSQLWRTLLAEVLGALDEQTAQVAVLYYLEDHSRCEVAAQLGVSPRTVGYRLEALHRRVHG